MEHNPKDILTLAQKRRHIALLQKLKDGKTLSQRDMAELASFEKGKKEKVSFAERMANNLRAKNEERLSAQEIGPLPEVVHPQRKAAAATDFKFFCQTYFPDIFYLEWSDDHLRVIAKIEKSVLEGGLFAFAMPRGSGKSALTMAAAVWAIFTGARKYVCLIGSATRQSLNLYQGVKAAIMGNERLLEDYPEVVFPLRCLENNAQRQRGQRLDGELTHSQWGTHKIVMPAVSSSPANGSVISVDSLDSNIRGQVHTTISGQMIRPDLVLIDDPQTRESAKSPEQTAQRLATLKGDVLGLAGPGKKISGLLTCTKIYADDLADQILDQKKNPEWQGECTKLLYTMPAHEKLWDEYARIRADSLRAGTAGKEATEFYRVNRAAMDAGAAVAWPQRHNTDEISALQHAMNLYFRDEVAFFAEYQNDPIAEQSTEEVLNADQVLDRINGRPRCEVPLRCQYLTLFIDVHDKLLYFVVCAWEDDFTGYVIDYGTYPDQKRLFFSMRDAHRTLQDVAPKGSHKEGAIQQGLETLCGDYLNRIWTRAGGGVMRIDRCLIDGGYKPGIVQNVRQKMGGVIMASKGLGIKAGNKPISTYRRKPGERYGHHWYIPNVNKSNEFGHVVVDTNFWKTFSHERWMTSPGDAGSLTLFGNSPATHKLFADHIASSETWVKTEGHGRVVFQWTIKPNNPDNHWFDCLVGCCVAASMCGCTLAGHGTKKRHRPAPIKLSDIQRKHDR